MSEHWRPLAVEKLAQCAPYGVHSASPHVQSVHLPALGSATHVHWVVPSAGFRTFTIC